MSWPLPSTRQAAFLMTLSDESRRSFMKTSVALAGAVSLIEGMLRAQPDGEAGPLLAYVGTFSSPLRDVLPTQVDLPPGNGRGIHLFQVNRDTGALTAADVHEMGTSPSCLALNAAGTRLYSANETDRIGDKKEGSVSAFAVDRATGKLKPLNTVRSGGAGPTFVSIHPSGRFALVANYFGGSVAVLPILEDGRLGAATDVQADEGKVGPTRATNAPRGRCAFSGHDRTHAHMIQANPAGRFVLHVDLGLDKIFSWKFDEKKGTLAPNDPAAVSLPAGMVPGISTSTPTASGSTRSRKRARLSCCSTTAPTRVGWPRGKRSPLCREASLGATSVLAFWPRPTVTLSTPATGYTTPSGSFRWGRRGT
jgi:6-phosphogluconolactonase